MAYVQKYLKLENDDKNVDRSTSTFFRGPLKCPLSFNNLPHLSAPPPTANQPPTLSVPVIVSEVTGNTIYLKCSFESRSNSSLGYVVAWSRLSPEGRKEELKQETTIQTFAFIELDGFNLRLGDKVCMWVN